MRIARLWLVLLGLVLLVLAAWASAATGRQVGFKSGDETVNGMLYTPSGAGPFPAIVVIHEWWGLNDWIKEQASRLADQGYVTLAVDLYRGKVANDPDTAHQLMRGLPESRAIRDLESAVAYLKTRKDVKPDRIGDIGWCMGGGYALQLAIADPTLKAADINYGHLEDDPATLAKIHAAILGNFGGQDKGIPPEEVRKFAGALHRLGKTADIKIYPDAGHAFENPNNKQGYRPQDAADAMKRTDEFFARELKQK